MRHIEKARSSLSDKQYQYIDEKTKQKVYDAVNALQSGYENKVKVRHIWLWLDSNTKEWNKQQEADGWDNYDSGLSGKTKAEMRTQIQKDMKRTISKRTIERIIYTDPRIVKAKGNSYHIDEDARFETRYQDPYSFGRDMLMSVMEGLVTEGVSRTGKKYKMPQEFIMTELGRRFGALILFNFIEAVRPFKDKCMSLKERNELVNYWKKNVLDIDQMSSMFVGYLAHEWIARERDQTLAPQEMDESDIDKLVETFKKAYPDLYENLRLARMQQAFVLDEETRKETGGKIGFVHGKTYLRGWQDYYNYLEQTNPGLYKIEMERIRKESEKS